MVHNCTASASPKLEILHDLFRRKWHEYISLPQLKEALGKWHWGRSCTKLQGDLVDCDCTAATLQGCWHGAPTGPPHRSEHGHCHKRNHHLRSARQVVQAVLRGTPYLLRRNVATGARAPRLVVPSAAEGQERINSCYALLCTAMHCYPKEGVLSSACLLWHSRATQPVPAIILRKSSS